MESLDRLREIAPDRLADRRQEALVLMAFAKTNLGTSTAHEVYERLPELLELTRSGPDVRTRAKAARAAANVLGLTRDTDKMERLLTVVDDIPQSELDPDSAGHLILARSMLLYHVRRTAESWSQVNVGIADLRRRGVANLVMVQLHLGLGSIRSCEGRYAEAAVCNENALQMATRLGNDTQATVIAGNLSLCYSRLGRHAEQLQLVAKIPPPSGPEFVGFVEMQYAYSTAISQIALGRNDQAYEAIKSLNSRLIGSIPQWMTQAWRLWEADLLTLMNRSGEANSAGKEGTAGFSYKLLSSSFAGPFARWIARTTKRGDRKAEGIAVVRSLVDHLVDFDAIDQVGILMAMLMLRGEEGKPGGDPALDNLLSQKLQLLPQAVRAELRVLEEYSHPR